MNRNWAEELGAFSNDVEEVWKYLKGEIDAGIKHFVPLCKGNSWIKKQSWSKPIDAQQQELIHKNTGCGKIY